MPFSLRDIPTRFGRITQSDTYVPQIDGLRFLAIMEVVFYHATFRGERAVVPPAALQHGLLGYLPIGVAGVELFFFISGYIIAFPFLSGSPPSLRSFYGRRLTRLEPPYLLVVLLCFVAVTMAGDQVGFAPQLLKSHISNGMSFLASCFYVNGLVFTAPPRLNPPLWSLEIEIQFYLLAPFIIAIYRSLGQRQRRVAVGLTAAAVFLVIEVLTFFVVPNLHFNLIGNFYPFLLGIAICDASLGKNPFRQAPNSRFDAVFLIGLFLFLISASVRYPWAQLGMPACMADLSLQAMSIVLLYFGCARGTIARKVIGAPWVALIGGACYSIYLVHIPVMQAVGNFVFKHAQVHSLGAAFLLSLLTLVPTALIAGMAYYFLIERPCMQKDWPQRLLNLLMGRGRALPSAQNATPSSMQNGALARSEAPSE